MPLPNRINNILKQSISSPCGEGYYDSVWLSDDARLTHVHGTFHSDQVASVSLDGLTRFSFIMSCDVTMAFDGITTINAFGPSCQVLHHPLGVQETECVRANKLQHWIMICFRKSFLINYLGLTSENTPAILGALEDDKQNDFMVKHLPLQLEMRRCLMEISHSEYRDSLRRPYIEAKGMELICMLMNQLDMIYNANLPNFKLRPRDKEILHETKRILETEFRSPPSAIELAQRLGTNRNKLSYGFRLLLGQTMSDYCRDLRLNLAVTYLRDTDKPISLIAEEVGYTSCSTFSVAFNRRFNMTPSQVRLGMKPEISASRKIFYAY